MFNFRRKVIIQVIEVRLRIKLLSWTGVRVPPLSWLLSVISFPLSGKQWHKSILRRKRSLKMGIAGCVLFYAKVLRREQFRANTVAPNMVESRPLWSLSLKCDWKLVDYEPALSWRAFFHAIVWVWTCLFFIFESDSSIYKGDQLAMWFSVSEKKIFCELWKKENAGAIAMGISCSYKEEGFWENRTFLWHTRTKKFLRSLLQDLPLLTSSGWQWANLCNFSLFYTS